MERRHFSSIAEYNGFRNVPAPGHPMFSYTAFDSLTEDNTISYPEPVAITTDFYGISYKKVLSGEMGYGRTKYDFDNGSMLFIGPRQEIVTKGLTLDASGAHICIHEDFIKGEEIRNRIKRYSYFSYTVNEALHLSPQEEQLVKTILATIEMEYRTNPDEFSKEIILSHVDTLLRYANRYYKRQFINRKDINSDAHSKFQICLSDYFDSGKFELEGVPKIEDIAETLGMSPRYLSDSLRTETGKGARDHIHLYLLDEAKNLLLEPNITVAEVAYKLGFEYPHYFSRLFKKKVGMNPTEYQKQHLIH